MESFMKWIILTTLFLFSITAHSETHEWKDGEITKKVYEVIDKMVVFENGKKPLIIEKNPNEPIPSNLGNKKYSECFSLSPDKDSRFRGLPGGLMIHFPMEYNEEKIKSWAKSKNLNIKNKVPIITKNIWYFYSESGLKSLLLANEVIKDENVLTASPNWWRPVRKR